MICKNARLSGSRSCGELQLQDEGDLPRSDGQENHRSPKRSNRRRRQVRIDKTSLFRVDKEG